MTQTRKTSTATGPRDRNETVRSGQGGPEVPADGVALSLTEPLLDCPAAAALLNVRVSWVRDAAREGNLPCVRVGRHLRFTRMMLEEWLAEQFDQPTDRHRREPETPVRTVARPARAGFRRNTEAALLASLAEAPRARKGPKDE